MRTAWVSFRPQATFGSLGRSTRLGAGKLLKASVSVRASPEPGGVVGLAEQICVTFHEMRVRFMSVAALKLEPILGNNCLATPHGLTKWPCEPLLMP